MEQSRSESNGKVSAIIKLFESRCKKENALRLNKPLSKSFSALSNSEWKVSRNVYENQDSIRNIEDRVTLFISKNKKYDRYSKEVHISHHQELLQILIDVLNIDVDNSQAVLSQKKEVVRSIVTQFEKLNNKLPRFTNNHFDFSYIPYSSLPNTPGSSQTSPCDTANPISPNIIVEDGYILGSVEKLKELFNNNSSDGKVQSGKLKIDSNNVVEDFFLPNPHVIVEKDAAPDEMQKTKSNKNEANTVASTLKDNSSSMTPQTRDELHAFTSVETRPSRRVYENEDNFITEISCSPKYFEADSQFRNDPVSDPKDAIQFYLNSRRLDEISRNKNGMQNVSSLKRIFETESTEELLEGQNITEDESRPEESLHDHVCPLMRKSTEELPEDQNTTETEYRPEESYHGNVSSLKKIFDTTSTEELPEDQNINEVESRQEESFHENVSSLKKIFDTTSTEELPVDQNINEVESLQEESFHKNVSNLIRIIETELTEQLLDDLNVTEAESRQKKYFHENVSSLKKIFDTTSTKELPEDQNINEVESRQEESFHENVSNLIRIIETELTEQLLEDLNITEVESRQKEYFHENVSSLKKIFDTTSSEELPESQNINDVESRQVESFHESVSSLTNTFDTISTEKLLEDQNITEADISSEDDQQLENSEKLFDTHELNTSCYNNEDEKAFNTVESEEGELTEFRNNFKEEQTNIPPLRGQPDLVESTVDAFPTHDHVHNSSSLIT